MPREKPFRCSKCGQLYVTALCPDCYPPKKRKSSGGGRGGVSRPARRRIDRILWSGWDRIGVNVDAVAGHRSDEDQADGEDEDQGGGVAPGY
jgi:hypothetical protein